MAPAGGWVLIVPPPVVALPVVPAPVLVLLPVPARSCWRQVSLSLPIMFWQRLRPPTVVEGAVTGAVELTEGVCDGVTDGVWEGVTEGV